MLVHCFGIAKAGDLGHEHAGCEQFVSIDWADTSILNEMPVVKMSEKQFVAPSPNERNSLAPEAFELAIALKETMFYGQCFMSFRRQRFMQIQEI